MEAALKTDAPAVETFDNFLAPAGTAGERGLCLEGYLHPNSRTVFVIVCAAKSAPKGRDEEVLCTVRLGRDAETLQSEESSQFLG